MRALLLLLLWLPVAAAAQEVVGGLSQSRISINTAFDGSEILIFGAVKGEVADDDTLGVLIAVEGPSREVTVRRKERVAGIWINTDSVEVDAAPTFYAVSTSAPWRDILRDEEDLRYRISPRRAIRSVGANVSDAPEFTNALIRIRSRDDLYQVNEGAVEISEGALFTTSMRLPANLTEGTYRARFFLTRDGEVIARAQHDLDVSKVGLERFLYNLAHEQPLVYGLLSLAIAIAAGWGASAAFRYFRA